MKNFKQPGDIVAVPAPANVSSGDGVLVGTLFGVAAFSALATKTVEIKTSGVFELPKVSTEVWTVGAAIYWDAGNKVCTTTATDNTQIGVALAATVNPSSTGFVRLGVATVPGPTGGG